MTGRPPTLAADGPRPVFGAGMSAVELGRVTGLRAPRLLSTLVQLEGRGRLHRAADTVMGPDRLPRYQAPVHPGGAVAWDHLRTPRRLPAGWVNAVACSTWLAALVVLLCVTVCLYRSGGDVPVDLEVYRRGGASLLAGTPIYEQPSGWLPFTYPPLAAAVFTVLAVLPASAATVLAAAGSCTALYVIARITLQHLGIDRAWAPVVALAGAMLEPVTATLDFGQVNLVLAAMILLDLLRPSRRWSGVLLGLAICIKVTPAIFLLLLLRSGDRAMLRRTLLTAAAGTFLPAMLAPASWTVFWFHALWDPGRVGAPAYAGNQSLTGAIWRLTGPGGAPAITYLISFATLGVLVLNLRRRDTDRLTAVLACAFTGLLISPISWSHHWVWILPMTLWAARTPRRHRRAGAALAVAWLTTAATRVLWLGPHGENLEYTATLPLLIATDAYTLLGAVTLALLLAELRAPHGRPDPSRRAPSPIT